MVQVLERGPELSSVDAWLVFEVSDGAALVLLGGGVDHHGHAVPVVDTAAVSVEGGVSGLGLDVPRGVQSLGGEL